MKRYGFAVLVFALFYAGGEAGCNRKFTATEEVPDDCSTHVGIFNDTDAIPCFVYNSGIPSQLEFPDPNTRTCYRTCHDEDLNPKTCEASLTGVHNQNIPYEASAANTTTQILFSPNYNDEGKNYRKSTICRYDVTCAEGMIMQYMFVAHELENRTNSCAVDDKCVDYVKLSFPNSTDEVITCGEEVELNYTFADGYSGLSVEFYTNREEETKGFSVNVMCYEPNISPSVRKRATDDMCREEAEEGDRGGDRDRDRDRLQETDSCECLPNTVRNTVDSAELLREALSTDRIAQDDLNQMERCRKFIINELETLHYHSNKLLFNGRSRHRHQYNDIVEEAALADNIRTLTVSSRFSKSRSFYKNTDLHFQGYAELWICGAHAYLLQLGINPLFRPTYEEEQLIAEFKIALSQFLVCDDFFDVYDELDAQEEGVEFVPSTCESHFERDPRLDDLARRFGDACNDFLRYAACTYQAVILNENCTQPKFRPTSPPHNKPKRP